jgi:hypothetical protein
VGVSIFLDALFGGITALGVQPAALDAAFLDLLASASLFANLGACLEGIWGASPALDLLRARRLRILVYKVRVCLTCSSYS